VGLGFESPLYLIPVTLELGGLEVLSIFGI
jgi:hypothetical protein